MILARSEDIPPRSTSVARLAAPMPGWGTMGTGSGRPSLFVIGAMKSGTTYLRKLLAAHPAIFMCEPDEPSYFVDPAALRVLWPEMWRRRIWRDRKSVV